MARLESVGQVHSVRGIRPRPPSSWPSPPGEGSRRPRRINWPMCAAELPHLEMSRLSRLSRLVPRCPAFDFFWEYAGRSNAEFAVRSAEWEGRHEFRELSRSRVSAHSPQACTPRKFGVRISDCGISKNGRTCVGGQIHPTFGCSEATFAGRRGGLEGRIRRVSADNGA